MYSEVGGVQAASTIFFSPSVTQFFFFCHEDGNRRVIESGAFCEN